MSCTPARLLANRANALKSSGPKTPEGKEVSRRNTLKHGLTGGGVVILGEDVDAVDERAEALQVELAPEGSLMTRILVRRVAAMSVRAERCVRQETAEVADRVRTAPDDFDEARRARADRLLGQIDHDPATHHRQLLAMPEGVDLLLSRLLDLRADLGHRSGRRWTDRHARMFDEATGRGSAAVPASRCQALTETILGGWSDRLDDDEILNLDAGGQIDRAAARMLDLIDSEIARLEDHRATLDLETIALSREESPQRALFDPGHSATLARKYEANAERAMYKALKELREIRLEARTARPIARNPLGTPESHDGFVPDRFEPNRSLGSFFPASPGGFSPSDFKAGLTLPATKPWLNPPIHGSDSVLEPKTAPSSPPRID